MEEKMSDEQTVRTSTEETDVTAKPKPKPTKNPVEMAQAVTSVLPGLDPSALTKIMRAHVLMQGRTVERALQTLERSADKITKVTLAQALAKINTELDAQIREFWSQFVDRTWEGDSARPPKIDLGAFEKRLRDELAQQSDRKTAGQQILNAILTLVDKFAISRDSVIPPPPPRQKLDLAGKIPAPIKRFMWEEKPVDPGETLGWLTPARIGKDENSVKLVLEDLKAIADEGYEGDAALSEIESRLGYTRTDVIKVFKDIASRAQKQVSEAETITKFSETDFENNIRPKARAIDQVVLTCGEVQERYQLTPPQAAKPASSATR